VDVPDLSLSAADLLGRLQCFAYRIIPNIPTATGYGAETVIMVWRDPTPRPAVYTAIMGGYDRLPDLPPGIVL
jgi:hypothetical protein